MRTNKTRRQALAMAFVLFAVPAFGQEPTPFRWGAHESIPARISDGLVTVQVVATVIRDWQAADRQRAFLASGCSAGLTLLVNEVLKRTIQRDRPNHHDRKSFPSMHTGLAASMAAWHPPIGASIVVGVGWGRMASGFHFGSDVIVGASIGLVSSRLCQRMARPIPVGGPQT